MVLHPAFLAGLAVTLAAILVGWGEEAWAGEGYYDVQVAWTFTWVGTLVAAALVAGRDRFLDDPEIFPAMPATPGERVVATALALSGPALAVAVAVAVVAAIATGDGGFAMGEGAYARAVVPPVAEWAQPVVLVALAGAVGIAVAQLRRGRLAVLCAVAFATFVSGSAVWAFQAHPVRVLHPFMYPSYEKSLPPAFVPSGRDAGDQPTIAPGEHHDSWEEVRFDTTALHWHLVYLTGLLLTAVWLARRSADRDEPPSSSSRWLALAGVPLAVIGGVAQVVTAGVAA